MLADCFVMLLSCQAYNMFCKGRSVLSRHNGHCDEATPDERAPFRVWSLLFMKPVLQEKARDFVPGFVFRVGDKIRNPCRPCRRRPASPELRFASSALPRPSLRW